MTSYNAGKTRCHLPQRLHSGQGRSISLSQKDRRIWQGADGCLGSQVTQGAWEFFQTHLLVRRWEPFVGGTVRCFLETEISYLLTLWRKHSIVERFLFIWFSPVGFEGIPLNCSLVCVCLLTVLVDEADAVFQCFWKTDVRASPSASTQTALGFALCCTC